MQTNGVNGWHLLWKTILDHLPRLGSEFNYWRSAVGKHMWIEHILSDMLKYAALNGLELTQKALEDAIFANAVDLANYPETEAKVLSFTRPR